MRDAMKQGEQRQLKIEIMAINALMKYTLFLCPSVTLVWAFDGYDFSAAPVSSFGEFLVHVLSTLPASRIPSFAMLLYQIWFARNKLVWQQQIASPYSVVTAAACGLRDWLSHQVRSSSRHTVLGQILPRWIAPPEGAVKCNVDATIYTLDNKFSYGAVIRDHRGSFIKAVSGYSSGLCSPRVAETIAMREVLSWLRSLHLGLTIIETDCLQLVNAVQGGSLDYSDWSLVLGDIKHFISQSSDISIAWVKRHANQPAHSLARAACYFASFCVWDMIPDFIQYRHF
ncbi:uncharacterized protein LOC105644961 [Jatropha curcas]|uniref:uncharacterized protein LOC105644961 n=1 Tax=Jatropha curcas TaxID=180498 RepID=UPI0005FAB841|nr:uncharacterized protein LOC105644961 [Jatropha curcas]